MDKKPYLISAVTGNSRLLAGFSDRGRLERLFWPRIDTPQNINRHWLGVIAGKSSKTYWLHGDDWKPRQSYIEETNILTTVLSHKKLNMEVSITDFAVPGENLMVRKVTVKNCAASARNVKILLYSDMQIEESRRYHTAVYRRDSHYLWQYKKNSHFIIGGDLPVCQFQCGMVEKNIAMGALNSTAHKMAPDAALLWDLGDIPADGQRQLVVNIAMGHTQGQAEESLKRARVTGAEQLEKECLTYWRDYLAQAKMIDTGDAKLNRLYRRSVLVFSLMTDAEYGSMLAAPEVDEDCTECGGYAFCWGRDAAFITYAIDRIGLQSAGRKFYQWAMSAQSEDGSWAQRHYLDGAVAPNWGMQVDEIGSILWGMWQHYLIHQDEAALHEFWPSLSRGAEFLVSFLDERTGLPKSSFDLWEERYAEHTYSAVAVWAGLRAAGKAAEKLGCSQQAEVWLDVCHTLRETMEKHLWSERKQSFLRGLIPHGREIITDDIVDVSLIGMTYPFAFLPADDPRMQATAKLIEKKLTSPKVGGIKRYEDDEYIGGNPWILCTLWMALYYAAEGNKEKAGRYLEWVMQHRTKTGLLSEQVDKKTGEPAWVIPLTWSHAMLVLLVLELYGEQKG